MGVCQVREVSEFTLSLEKSGTFSEIRESFFKNSKLMKKYQYFDRFLIFIGLIPAKSLKMFMDSQGKVEKSQGKVEKVGEKSGNSVFKIGRHPVTDICLHSASHHSPHSIVHEKWLLHE